MPIFGKKPPRPPVGTPIGRRQKATLEIVEQLSRIGGGRGVTWTPGGPSIAQPGTDIRLGVSPSGGIPKMTGSVLGHGLATDAYIDVTAPTTANLMVGTTTFTAFNLSAYQDVPASVTIICQVLWGIWVVIWADCPS